MTNWKEEIRGYYNQQVEQSRQEQLRTQIADEQQRIEGERLHLEHYRTVVLPEFEILDQLNVSTSLLEIRDQIWRCGEVHRNPTQKLQPPYESHATYTLESLPYYTMSSDVDNYNIYKYTKYIKVSTNLQKITLSTNMGQFPSPEIELATNGYQARKEWLRQQLIIGCTFKRPSLEPNIDDRIRKYWYTMKQLYEEYPETRPPRTFLDKLLGLL